MASAERETNAIREKRKVGEIQPDSRATTASFEWTIRMDEDFFSLPQDPNNLLYSPKFSFLNTEWYLAIFPNGCSWLNNIGCIVLSLLKGPPATANHRIFYKIGIRRSDGTECNVVNGEGFSGRNYQWCRVPLALNRHQFLQRREQIVRNGNLTLFCTLQDVSSCGTAEASSQTEELPRHVAYKCESADSDSEEEYEDCDDGKGRLCNTEGLDTLSPSFRDLLRSEQFSDISIKIENTELRAHKAVLAARSPVFSAMLQHDMAEKNSNTIEICDCAPETFSEFLQYLYTGQTQELTQENICGVYILADKYGVQQLKDECVTIMRRDLNLCIFCDVIHLAMKFEEQELLQSATEFFRENVKSILESGQWQLFIAQNPTVANELFLKTVKKSKRINTM